MKAIICDCCGNVDESIRDDDGCDHCAACAAKIRSAVDNRIRSHLIVLDKQHGHAAMTSSRLAEWINTAYASCKNPEEFFGKAFVSEYNHWMGL